MGEANVNNCVLFFEQHIIMGDDLNRTFGVVAGADFTISLGCWTVSYCHQRPYCQDTIKSS